MTRSLQQTLSMSLSAALLLAALIAATVSFWLAYMEAAEAQDDLLRQVASVGYDGHPAATTSDPDARLTVLKLPHDHRPAWLPSVLAPGMHTLNTPFGAVRAWVSEPLSGTQLLVAQSTAMTSELALDSALRILLPFLLLIPLQALMILKIVQIGLAPVNELALQVSRQTASQAALLPENDMMSEILPFVSAVNGLLLRQRRFIADAAHELRTPLTALQLQVQNVAAAESLSVMRARLEPLQEGIARARRLTEQMLSLARVPGTRARSTIVDLQEVAHELVALFLPLCRDYRIDIGFLRSTRVQIMGNIEHVHQIVRNALENAINYTPPGGEVLLDIYSDNGNVVLDVIDEGPGIALADRTRVFEPFVRLSDAVGIGSGIGLAIAREAAHALSAEVSLHSRSDRAGLIFRFQQTRQLDQSNSHDTH